jgi:hypothetical protein
VCTTIRHHIHLDESAHEEESMKRFRGLLLCSVVVVATCIMFAPGASAAKGGSKPPSRPPEERTATQLEVGKPSNYVVPTCPMCFGGTPYTYTTLHGTLTTASGSPVEGRTLELRGAATCSAITDASGHGGCQVWVPGVNPTIFASGSFAGDEMYEPSSGSYPVSS